jgi:phosphate starvation-inducible PhoH-like protein
MPPLSIKAVLLDRDRVLLLLNERSEWDLPGGRPEGLAEALSILEGVEGVGIQRFSDADVVRHALVSRIVRAYTAKGR